MDEAWEGTTGDSRWPYIYFAFDSEQTSISKLSIIKLKVAKLNRPDRQKDISAGRQQNRYDEIWWQTDPAT